MPLRPRPPLQLSRRRFVQGLAGGGVLAGLGGVPHLLQAAPAMPFGGMPTLSGTEFDLAIGETLVNYTGRVRPAVTINGSLPAPLLRWKQGSTVTLRVRNALPRGSIHGPDTSIHWHGILLPANMDGVPGMSFDGIRPGESYLYRFTLRQSGTYWGTADIRVKTMHKIMKPFPDQCVALFSTCAGHPGKLSHPSPDPAPREAEPA